MTRFIRKPTIQATSALLIAGAAFSALAADQSTIHADVWADNWFALYVDGELVMEDSVSITTERSFNSESFEFTTTLPAQIGLMVKDFKENDTGLEYIGSRRQQMGDGGVIAQFIDADTGETLVVTNDQWRCLPIHIAPLNPRCEKSDNPEATCGADITPEPSDWSTDSFDDSDWPSATEHSYRDVRPKDGYDRIDWDSQAEFMWSEDLETHNTVLCRITLSQ